MMYWIVKETFSQRSICYTIVLCTTVTWWFWIINGVKGVKHPIESTHINHLVKSPLHLSCQIR